MFHKCYSLNNIYMKNYPSGTSLKSLLHFIQVHKAKKFVQFDYKKAANTAIYGSKEPPEYDINNLNVTLLIMPTNVIYFANLTFVDNQIYCSAMIINIKPITNI